MKTWVTVAGVVFADAAGNMALRRGMEQMGDVTACRLEEIPSLIYRAVKNKMLGIGVFCMAVAFFLFLALLSWADLSFALPATALGSVVNTVGARVLLKESVTTSRWVGTILICVGVVLISLNSGNG